MTTATIAIPKKEEPLLFEGLTWREFKAVEQLLDRPGYRLSLTLESKAKAVKREADKSYKLAPGRVRPDLAIKVVFTSGGINKLEAYKRLKIPEVWFWEDGVLEVYHLRGEGNTLDYEKVSSSEEVRGIDLDLLLRCINRVNHVDAIKTFQQALQK